MLKKDTFVYAINAIQEQRKKNEEFNDALDKICDGYPVFDVNNKYLEALLKIMKEEMHDDDDFIGWYLYEDVEKVVTVNDGITTKSYELTSPELLYDFLVDMYKLHKGATVKSLD